MTGDSDISHQNNQNMSSGPIPIDELRFGNPMDTAMRLEPIDSYDIGMRVPSVLSVDHSAPFKAHMEAAEVSTLQIGDRFDHRDKFGRYFKAQVADKRGSSICVRYEGWEEKWNIWCDSRVEPHRFAKYKSVSERPAHRLKDLVAGDMIDVYTPNIGWKYATIKDLDKDEQTNQLKSGQVQVIFSGNGPAANIVDHEGTETTTTEMVRWVHLDNTEECAVFATKANGADEQQTNIMKNIKQNVQQQQEQQNGQEHRQRQGEGEIESTKFPKALFPNLYGITDVVPPVSNQDVSSNRRHYDNHHHHGHSHSHQSRTRWEQHRRRARQWGPFPCSICCKKFDNLYELKSHLKVCGRKEALSPLRCHRCHLSFLSKSKFRDHVCFDIMTSQST